MNSITSGQNPVVKEIRALKNRKDREERGLFFIEGIRIVEEALSARVPIKYAVLSETFAAGSGRNTDARLEAAGAKTYTVPDGLFEALGETKTPQGLLAVLESREQRLGDAQLSGGLFVLLENIRDPGNMGTIIRTADAAGFSGVVVTGGCVDVYNPKVLRSTMGSVFHIPVFHHDDVADAISLFKLNGVRVAASHISGDRTIYETDLTLPTVLIIGSEAEGISREAEEASDLLVRIPMPGRAESLNASVAAGVMMYEALRQRLARSSRAVPFA